MENKFLLRGKQIREKAMVLVLDFMRSSPACRPNGNGIKQTELFKCCGFDWGDQDKAKSTQQQFWIVALLHVLESEGKVQQLSISRTWRLS